ncbi:hypothetical protein ZWY2020_036555 [Hordeum vulgare]|nr:hypothetical protein ZWY2020_036555 [Hordeum vulgare]
MDGGIGSAPRSSASLAACVTGCVDGWTRGPGLRALWMDSHSRAAHKFAVFDPAAPPRSPLVLPPAPQPLPEPCSLRPAGSPRHRSPSRTRAAISVAPRLSPHGPPTPPVVAAARKSPQPPVLAAPPCCVSVAVPPVPVPCQPRAAPPPCAAMLVRLALGLSCRRARRLLASSLSWPRGPPQGTELLLLDRRSPPCATAKLPPGPASSC